MLKSISRATRVSLTATVMELMWLEVVVGHIAVWPQNPELYPPKLWVTTALVHGRGSLARCSGVQTETTTIK